jgi:hypothetical protein
METKSKDKVKYYPAYLQAGALRLPEERYLQD